MQLGPNRFKQRIDVLPRRADRQDFDPFEITSQFIQCIIIQRQIDFVSDNNFRLHPQYRAEGFEFASDFAVIFRWLAQIAWIKIQQVDDYLGAFNML